MPIAARRAGPLERGWRWCRRRPAAAAAIGAALLAVVSLAAFGVGFAYQRELEDSNRRLVGSLDREKKLAGELRTALRGEEQQRKKADAAQQAAEFAAEAERTERKRAEAALDQVEQLQQELAEVLYSNRVNLAVAEWKAGNVERARRLLDDCPRELRQWEWHYAYRLCHPEEQVVSGRFSGGLAFSPDGRPAGGRASRFDRAGVESGNRREVCVLKGHTNVPRAVAFHPAGKEIATAGLTTPSGSGTQPPANSSTP